MLAGGRRVDYLCLTGQSGTSLNAFVRWFDRYLTNEQGTHLYDSYFNMVAGSSHADTTNPLFPSDEDMKKLGFVPGVSGERKTPINPLPLSNYMKGR